MRHVLARAVALPLAALLLAPAVALGNGGELTAVSGVGFPDRSFVLTLPPGTSLGSQQLQVRENGKAVRDLEVVSANAAGKAKFGVVLVIDATETMRGGAIRDAMRAARAFAAKRNSQQPLGVVTFNVQPRTLLPPTTDQAAIDSALAGTPSLFARGTHINDAVAAALRLLEQANIAGGSIVVLSDGADTGSRAGVPDVADRARAAGVRIFTVALRSRSFDPSVLRSLASSGGGRYSETASSRALAGIYGALGSELANQYLIRYRSLAGLDSRVAVEAETAEGSVLATSEYVSPPLHERSAARPRQGGFWRSAAAMVVISFGCALVLALGILTLLALRPRTRSLAERMEGFVSPPEAEQTRRWSAALTGGVLAGAERSLARTRWWTTFKEELDVARVDKPAVQIVVWTVAGTLVATWLLQALSGSGLFALVGFGVPLGVRAYIKRRLERQRRLFADQLADNLQVIASAMRAGHSFIGALAVAVDDAPEPARTEFRRVVADERLGVPLEDALGVVVRRMQSRDLEQVVLVATLQRQTGGNTAEVIDRVAETIRERSELRRIVRILTAQGRMSRWVVTSLPVGLLLMITLINPGYMDPLYGTTLGHVLLLLSAAMVAAGSFVIKRIVTIRV
jgi:tight adherence protein B